MVRRFIGMQLLEIVRALTMVIVAAVIMFSIHVPMALISMSTLPFLCAISFVYYKKVRNYFTYSDEAEGELSATFAGKSHGRSRCAGVWPAEERG